MRYLVSFTYVLILLSSGNLSFSQVPCPPTQAVTPNAVLTEIPDEPKTVDPATLVPAMLAKKVTVEFKDASIRDVITWMEEKQKIQVLIDPVLAKEVSAILNDNSISEKLDDAPLYLLLDRLEPFELSWYLEDEIIFLTTVEEVDLLMTYQSYNLSDLLDAGYTREALTETIHLMLPETNWAFGMAITDPEVGSLEWLDDVLFIRQTTSLQLHIAGIVEALRRPSRMRFTYDPPVHETLRKALETRVSVDLDQVPLNEAISFLAGETKTDMRFDHREFDDDGSRERVPVTLKLEGGKLSTILGKLLAPLDQTWILKDGAILITSLEQSAMEFKSAVYLIGDLCQDEAEMKSLFRVIMQQTAGFRPSGNSAYWNEESLLNDPEMGVILSPRPGVMIVREKENILLEIKSLLDRYRTQRQKSRPQKRNDSGDEILTRYYLIHSDVANDLEQGLPLIVEPGTWTSESNPDGPGQVLLKVASPSKVKITNRQFTQTEDETPAAAEKPSYSVLVIRHKRKVHEQIEKIFDRIQNGDPTLREETLNRIAPVGFRGGN